ncbi:MAG: arginine deiminase family protein, partial [Anaerolineae bacterium]
MKALVRPPGDSYRQALSSQQPRPEIDVDRARRQHAAYCDALRQAGLDLIELPPDEAHPDACFVQDTAVVYGLLAVIARPGAESRRGEEAAVAEVLGSHRRLADIRAPATLEGGDVLIVGNRVFVGLSERTNRGGFVQLRDLLELEGAAVQSLEVAEGLHLLSGCTYLGRGVLLAAEAWAHEPPFAGLDVVQVPPEEEAAANALGLGDYAILPAGYPRTAALIR